MSKSRIGEFLLAGAMIGIIFGALNFEKSTPTKTVAGRAVSVAGDLVVYTFTDGSVLTRSIFEDKALGALKSGQSIPS